MAVHLRMRRPRLKDAKCVTQSYLGANPDGLGTLSKLPREIRDQIMGYVMDINSKLEDYIRGVEETYDPLSKIGNQSEIAEFIRKEAYVGHENINTWSSRYDPIPIPNFQRPRRTDILAVSKALSGEALEVMLKTNRFILRRQMNRFDLRRQLNGTVPFDLFALKDDIKNKGTKYIPELGWFGRTRWAWMEPQCPYLEDLARYMNSKIRLLVLDFRFLNCVHDRENGRYAHGEVGTSVGVEGFSKMLEIIKYFKNIHSLRVIISISVSSREERELFLPVIEELSHLRSIRELEVRGSLRYGFEKHITHEHKSDSRIDERKVFIDEQKEFQVVCLTREYCEYLKSAARNAKGVKVRPYEGFMLTGDEVEIRLGDLEIERERSNAALMDDEEDRYAFDALEKARTASNWMPWYYSRTIPAPEPASRSSIVPVYVWRLESY